jgi:2-polyprenyl-3-methyl-5-hydroxy-6-metoxy-1,4-benzoquinol methylase
MYSNIISHFDKTRSYIWNCVKTFLTQFEPNNKLLLEAGCGNGRNLIYAKSIGFQVEGYDICQDFVSLCNNKGLNCFTWDIRNQIQNQYDIILCIAVIHHLENKQERLLAINNLFIILKPEGQLLITLWSLETKQQYRNATSPKIFNKGDNLVPWKTHLGEIKTYRYYYIYDRKSIEQLIIDFQSLNQSAVIELDWEEQNWILKISKNTNML